LEKGYADFAASVKNASFLPFKRRDPQLLPYVAGELHVAEHIAASHRTAGAACRSTRITECHERLQRVGIPPTHSQHAIDANSARLELRRDTCGRDSRRVTNNELIAGEPRHLGVMDSESQLG
jgi:hypothetical protein